MPKKVAIAIDDSKTAEEALNFYIRALHKGDDELILLHIPEIEMAAASHSLTFSQGAWRELHDKSQSRLEELQAKYEKKLDEQNMKGRWINVHNASKPGEGIVQAAEQSGADMIITGTRGMGRVRRTVMGSVSDYIMHHSNVPVLICNMN